MTTRIGAQMYTLRDYCKTSADIASTCRKLSEIGFGAVQASALGPIEPVELRKILDDNGLVCAATHRGLDQMRDDPQAMIDEHQILGCELTALGGFGFDEASESDWDGFIEQFNRVAESLAMGGLRVGYHNHSHEWAPFDPPQSINPRRTPIGKLMDGLADQVWFELDTYWVAHAGADPAHWIRSCAGRIPAVHVKDMTITPDREQKMCEVGAGNLNWPAILDACKAADVRWYLIERDNGDLDPFESLRISLENLHEMGIT
jgi:sugar phosphate isomerase/epimerase